MANDDNNEKGIIPKILVRDTENGRGSPEKHPPMTLKRFMAIFSLACLLAAAQIPLYLIGGSLCKTIVIIR